MAHMLKELLGNDHPLFAQNIVELEKSTGNDGVDVRLLTDILARAHKILREIGLDPVNTTGIEAYQALKNLSKTESGKRILQDSDFVLMLFGKDLVSFNLHDIIENTHHELDFAHRTTEHAKRHLRREVVRRYAEHERTHEKQVHLLTEEVGLKRPSDEDYPIVHDQLSDPPTVLAIGDIFTDAFIKLNQEVARIDVEPDGSKRISLPLGSKPPYDGVEVIRAVGPSPNAAVSMARLGLDVALRAFLGDDVPGQEAIEHLRKESVKTELLSVQNGVASNYYYVLRFGAERTILVKNENYQYTWKAPTNKPHWIYLSLLSEQSWELHEDMLDYLQENPQIKLAFQPGTFHFSWGVEKLKKIYERSYIVIMNREEAVEVTGKSYDSIKDLTLALHELGPDIVVITDGPNGSYASYDWKLVTIPNYPDPQPPVDRTGAGDAFASTIVAALAMGESMDTALTWAPINSMSVVQYVGAQAGLLTIEKIRHYLKKAPANYNIKEIIE